MQAIAEEIDLIHWTFSGMSFFEWNSQLFTVLRHTKQINMYTDPMMVAVSKEIKAPVYIDVQIVRRADGLSRFQAIGLSSSC